MSFQIYFQSTKDIVITEQLLSRLQPQRRKRLLSFHSTEDRLRCMAAGLLLWEHIYHQHPEQYTVQYNDFNKPFVSDAPFFNLSHSSQLVMLAVSNSPVGCDIEHSRKPVLSPHVFHPRELQFLQHLPEESRISCFLRLWTAKEALCKALGEGLLADVRSHDLSDIITSEASLLTLPDGSAWEFKYINPPGFSNYTACVCCQALQNHSFSRKI